MPNLILAAKAVLVAGAALSLAACGGEADVANNAGSDLEANASLDSLGNDASAMEAAGNAADTLPAPADNAADEEVDGEAEGGDTGGNNVESNTVGM